MAESKVNTIHLSRTPPPNVEAFALSQLSTFCQRVTQGLEVPLDTSIFVGDVNLLPSGDDRLLHLRLIVVPWAGPFVKPATKELLARQDDDSLLAGDLLPLRNYPTVPIFTLHHNAAPTAEMAISLLLAAAKQVWQVKRVSSQTTQRPPGLYLARCLQIVNIKH